MAGRIKRVPEIIQQEATECGAASLGMVLAYYGKYLNLSQLREACKISRDGSNLANIANAAKDLGLEVSPFRVGADLKGISFPAIGYWKGYHFIVLEGVTKKGISVCDPELGHRVIPKEEFEKYFSNLVLCLKPSRDFKKEGKPFNSASYILGILGNTRFFVFILFVLLFASHILNLLIPLMEQMYIDKILPSVRNIDTTDFFIVFLMLLFMQLLVLLFQNRMLMKFERAISAFLTEGIIRKLLFLPWNFFQSRTHSTLESRLGRMNDFTDYLAGRGSMLVFQLIFSAMYFLLLVFYSPFIAGAVFVIIAAIAVGMYFLVKRSRSQNVRAINELSRFYVDVSQSLRMFDTIKSTGRENETMGKNMKAYYNYEMSIQASKETLSMLQTLPVAAPLLLQTTVFCCGAYLYMNDMISLGRITACQSLALSLFMPITNFVMDIFQFEMHLATVDSLKDIQDEKEDSMTTRDNPVPASEFQGRIELRKVSFGYNKAAAPTVEGISAFIEKGNTIAFVGGSGSGKSTILQLIQGLYNPWSGEILFDGALLADTNREQMASSIAVVSQNPAVFLATVTENITLFNPNIEMSRVEKAARLACIFDDIIEMRDGFNTRLDPMNMPLSGGQIQRLMIARALAKNPKVIIIDEATSALDTLVEQKIMENIRALGITMIVVAHRLSAIRDSDEIVVLKGGRIKERGNHEQLMAISDGEYKRLILAEGVDD